MTSSPKRYTSANEAIAEFIAPSLADPASYDLRAIFDACFMWRADRNAAGEERIDTAGFELVVTDGEYWSAVRANVIVGSR